MRGNNMLILGATVLALAVVSGVAASSQDKYTLRRAGWARILPDFRGYEDWQVVAVSSKTDDRLKVMVGQSDDDQRPTGPAFRATAGRFPEGSKIAKVRVEAEEEHGSPILR